MASDTKNVKLGVCKVFFDDNDLGYTQGGVEVTVSSETHKVEVDQFGKTPINEYVMGRSVTAKVPLAETTLENLAAIMPGATLVTDGVDPTKKRVDVSSGIGTDLLSIAKELRLHPIGKADSDKSDDFVIHQAATAGALNFAYKVDAERIFNCEFMGYPDATTGKLFSVGDPAATAAG
jgi:hypothetical protein